MFYGVEDKTVRRKSAYHFNLFLIGRQQLTDKYRRCRLRPTLGRSEVTKFGFPFHCSLLFFIRRPILVAELSGYDDDNGTL